MRLRLSPKLNTALNQKGDTLIEVLICIMIVTVILTGAYVTTQKASQGVRNSQEHAEVLKIAQSQLEEVRENANITSGSKVFSIVPPFCMVDSTPIGVAVSSGKCVQDSSGQPTSTAPLYNVSINRTPCNNAGPKCWLFTVKVTWDTITNDGVSSEQISYRLHDGH